MKAVYVTLLCTAMLIMPSLVFTDPGNRPSVIRKTLICGDAQLIAESTCLYVPNSADKQCVKQTIRLINTEQGIPKQLPHDGKLVKQKAIKAGPVLDNVVTAWDCLHSKSETPYILLWYTCNWGPGCEGTNREWERIFTTDGTHLTAGFRKHDLKRLNKLYQRLGLSDEDIRFKSVIFDE